MMYKFRECHSNKVLTNIFVEPTAVWTDEVNVDGELADCFVFVDNANNKYILYTKDKTLYNKLNDALTYNSVFDTSNFVVMNETHFIEECSDIEDEKEQVQLASDVMNYILVNFNKYEDL